MAKMRKIAVLTVAVGVITIGGASFASAFQRPVEIVSQLTQKPVEELRVLREEGDTYGEIAEKYGVRDEFKVEMKEKTIALIEEKLEKGLITEEQAEYLLERACEENGEIRIGQEIRAEFGNGLHGNNDGEGKQQNMQQVQKRTGRNLNQNIGGKK